MSVDANGTAQGGGPPKRKLRNYLLDRRFQLKYTGMVVAVTMVVAAVLGYFAYRYSRGQTEALSIQMAMQPDLHPDVAEDLEGWARAEDRKVLAGIVVGILILALALGFTGIVVTHKVVGPAYKLRRLIGDVAEGKLRVEGRLRKGDELQDVFEAFAHMVEQLRARQAEEIALLDEALERASAGIEADKLQPVREVRERMQTQLE